MAGRDNRRVTPVATIGLAIALRAGDDFDPGAIGFVLDFSGSLAFRTDGGGPREARLPEPHQHFAHETAQAVGEQAQGLFVVLPDKYYTVSSMPPVSGCCSGCPTSTRTPSASCRPDVAPAHPSSWFLVPASCFLLPDLPLRSPMPQIVKCGLIQASHATYYGFSILLLLSSEEFKALKPISCGSLSLVCSSGKNVIARANTAARMM